MQGSIPHVLKIEGQFQCPTGDLPLHSIPLTPIGQPRQATKGGLLRAVLQGTELGRSALRIPEQVC